MIQADKAYVHGATAEKLEYNVYEENSVLKAKKNQRANTKIKVKIVCNVFFAFLLCFAIIYRYAVITELNYNIDKANGAFTELKNENSRLKMAIEKETDLNRIGESAENKLGMQKPDRHQIVYINIPKSDYSLVSEKYDNKSNTVGTFAVILDKIGRITSLLY